MSKFRKSRNKTDHENFKRQRSKVNIIVRKAKNQNYQNQLSESAKDPDKFWKTLKSTFLVKNKKNCQILICGECYIKWLEHHCKRFLIVATTIKWIAILLKDLHGAGTSWFRKSHFSETGKSSMRNKFYSCNYSILNLPLDEIIPVPGYLRSIIILKDLFWMQPRKRLPKTYNTFRLKHVMTSPHKKSKEADTTSSCYWNLILNFSSRQTGTNIARTFWCISIYFLWVCLFVR